MVVNTSNKAVGSDESLEKRKTINNAISSVLNKQPDFVKDYKKLAMKIRDEYGLKITNDEIEEYFEPDIESEMSTISNYYKLLNINY